MYHRVLQKILRENWTIYSQNLVHSLPKHGIYEHCHVILARLTIIDTTKNEVCFMPKIFACISRDCNMCDY